MLENSKKIRNYAGGEIHQTVDGYYIFVSEGSHCGPYVSISSLRNAVGAQAQDAEATESVVLDGATEEELLEAGVSQEDIDAAVEEGVEAEPVEETQAEDAEATEA